MGIAIYIVIGYFGIRLISKWISNLNVYIRLLIVSFCYALVWGIGIAASGGDPGFGFPVPNILAIGLMISIGFYYGALKGLIILSFWWILIFTIMLIRHLTKQKHLHKME
ncbi:hypothetical protein [Saccharicrinis sp. FJH62]|uniref:hypothetical protein n=1 Tax=Saccharicrinis sp. FJH62 TaxID=3344657 RepID=UPI0035D43C17